MAYRTIMLRSLQTYVFGLGGEDISEVCRLLDLDSTKVGHKISSSLKGLDNERRIILTPNASWALLAPSRKEPNTNPDLISFLKTAANVRFLTVSGQILYDEFDNPDLG